MRDRYSMEDEPLPGSDRERQRYGTIPMLASDVLPAPGRKDAKPFPFLSWALSAHFKYPKEATDLLCLCESAPEAFFAREFVVNPGIAYVNGAAVDVDGTTLKLQVRRGALRMDAVVERGRVKLAVEIDGMTFHARKYDQVAADYLRERRLIALGYVLCRFTAQEVFASAAECWKQIDTILTAHNRPFIEAAR